MCARPNPCKNACPSSAEHNLLNGSICSLIFFDKGVIPNIILLSIPNCISTNWVIPIYPGYEFKVMENTNGYYQSVTDTYQDQITKGVFVPRVSRNGMLLADNAYLMNATPTLSW